MWRSSRPAPGRGCGCGARGRDGAANGWRYVLFDVSNHAVAAARRGRRRTVDRARLPLRGRGRDGGLPACPAARDHGLGRRGSAPRGSSRRSRCRPRSHSATYRELPLALARLSATLRPRILAAWRAAAAVDGWARASWPRSAPLLAALLTAVPDAERSRAVTIVEQVARAFPAGAARPAAEPAAGLRERRGASASTRGRHTGSPSPPGTVRPASPSSPWPRAPASASSPTHPPRLPSRRSRASCAGWFTCSPARPGRTATVRSLPAPSSARGVARQPDGGAAAADRPPRHVRGQRAGSTA